MATQPNEEQGNLNQAEPAADIENVLASVGSASSQSGGASDCDQESNPMATQPSEEQGNLNQAEPAADVRVLVELDPSQFEDAPEISESVVDEPYYRPLIQAAFKGDWEFAKRFFKRDATSRTAKITSRSERVLHIAAWSAQDQFLENLVELFSPHSEELEMVDCDGRTALHIAVLCGSIRMVKALVRSNHRLTQLADNKKRIPLGISALEASMHKEIAWFLAKNTTGDGPSQPSSIPSAFDIIMDLSYAGHHALQCLTRSLWNAAKIAVPIIKRIHEVKLRHVAAVKLAKSVCIAISHETSTEITNFLREPDVLGEATTRGITEIVKLCIQFFPELIWISPFDQFDKRLTSKAVKHRQERTLNLFLKVGSTNELSLVPGPTAQESTEMMDAAAIYEVEWYHPNYHVAGAVFQMQREIQWYKAVESWVLPFVASAHFGGKSYWNKFVDGHQKLVEKGETWMKDKSNSCMLVSTLIATVLFTAAFTVPGGNDGKTGAPLLLGQDSFHVFVISDALGLFSSMTAILLFLAILTSRYEAQDFLYSLPKKIIMGLSLLFLSLVFMLVAFATTLTMVLDERLEWALIPVTLLASVPMALFTVLQLPLLFRMVKSTYGPSIFRSEGIWDGVKYTKQD